MALSEENGKVSLGWSCCWIHRSRLGTGYDSHHHHHHRQHQNLHQQKHRFCLRETLPRRLPSIGLLGKSVPIGSGGVHPSSWPNPSKTTRPSYHHLLVCHCLLQYHPHQSQHFPQPPKRQPQARWMWDFARDIPNCLVRYAR